MRMCAPVAPSCAASEALDSPVKASLEQCVCSL